MISRLGLIGDVHGEDERLERALYTFRRRQVPIVVSTGDIVDGRGSVDRCCELLEMHGVVAVSGNHDRWLLSGTARDLPDATPTAAVSEPSRAFLKRLPRMIELNTIEGTALLCHGLGPNDMAKVGPDDFGYSIDSNNELQNLVRNGYYRWVLCGHSHRRMVRTFGHLTIINAGTLIPEQASCFLEVDFENATVLAFEFARDGSVQGVPLRLTEGVSPLS